VQAWLADPVDGGWAASDRADPAAAHGRAVDRTLFTDWNALMVRAALGAGGALGDESLSAFAVRSLERIVLLAYAPGAGAAHYLDPDAGEPAQVRGLLDDQIALASAHLEAYDASGNVVYRMMAEELAIHAVRSMADAEGGGFFDRAASSPPDLPGAPVKTFAGNCAAATLLYALARVSTAADFRAAADAALAAAARLAPAQGALAAEYLLAAGERARG
jgi:uncharacterized protein YyaL (SSP411 family)